MLINNILFFVTATGFKPVADYGSAGYRFESCRDHRDPLQSICRGFLFFAQKLRLSLKTWWNLRVNVKT